MAKKKKAKEKPRSKLDELKIIRIFDFNLIPKYLLEQVKGSELEVPAFIRGLPILPKDPTVFLYVFADPEHIIKGFLCASVDVIGLNLNAQMLSIDKEYQGHGAVLRTKGFLEGVRKQLKLNKIYCCTTRSKALMRLAGAKPAKAVLMEL